jgi:8-oxo-dGTP diphosphatase
MNLDRVDKLFVATKAFVVNEGKVLVLQESTEYVDGTNAGKWDVVGGRLNPGENFRDALLREVKEETGLEVTIGAPFTVGEWRPNVRGEQWQIVAIFFECTADSNQVTLSEDHAAYQWLSPEEIQTLEPCASFIHQAADDYLKRK